MAQIKKEPISMAAMTSCFKEDGITKSMLLKYLTDDLGYIKDIRTITDKGLENGVSYVCRSESPNQKWPVYDTNVQKLLLSKINDIKKYESAELQECNAVSLTTLSKEFIRYDLTRDAILKYLINDLKYISDISTITPLGLKNGVSYKSKSGASNERWPVYDETVQKKISAGVHAIKAKYPELLKPANEQATRKGAPQPPKISVDDYPAFVDRKNANFNSFVAYDFETTGFSPKSDAIIEIGAVKVVNGVVEDAKAFTFQEFVKPYKKSLNSRITEITGIKVSDVINARQIWEVMPDFVDFIGDNILVGFNSASFDSKFLTRAGRLSNIIIRNEQFDVMRYALANKSTLGLYDGKASLAVLSNKFHIVNPQAHRALADAITTAKVFLAIKERL